MAWLQLALAGLLEVVWALGLKRTEGFTRLWPSVLTLAAMGLSFYLLARAVRTLPIGTAYAVWVGIGAVGTAVVAMLFMGESRNLLRVGSIMLIVAGVIGLRLADGH
ncbi:MAG TPA: quaternary ammonium compound efflux SMR transporter SugE [Myxococcaceae bacterium]|nr:quaternary ammonium compound efflux SMR transporter SugE [Myxococcaceae bacterium]